MLRNVSRALFGLASLDPFKRVRTLELILNALLWRQPRDAIMRHLEIPPMLPHHAIKGARLYADRETMLEVVPKGGEVAEVGVCTGYFSRHICAVVQPIKFHLIDLDFSPMDWSAVPCLHKVHKGDSSTILRGFPP